MQENEEKELQDFVTDTCDFISTCDHSLDAIGRGLMIMLADVLAEHCESSFDEMVEEFKNSLLDAQTRHSKGGNA